MHLDSMSDEELQSYLKTDLTPTERQEALDEAHVRWVRKGKPRAKNGAVEVLEQPSVDVRYLVKHLWMIFVILPLIVAILYVIVHSM